MRRDGLPRKKSTHAAFTWTGKPTAGNIGRGFADRWAKYEDVGDTGREIILMKLDAPATQSRPEAAMAAFAKSWRRE